MIGGGPVWRRAVCSRSMTTFVFEIAVAAVWSAATETKDFAGGEDVGYFAN